MAKKKKKKKKVSLKKQIRRLQKKADKALSDYVRKYTYNKYKVCPLCEIRPIQVSFHFISRRRKILRWYIGNVIGACRTCNYVEQFLPDYSRAWYIKTNGVASYLDLVERSKSDFTPTIEYLQDFIDMYTRELARISL